MLNIVFLRTKLGWEDFRSLREKWLTAIQLPRFWDVSLISGHRGVTVIYSGAHSFKASSTCCSSGSWAGCVWAYVSVYVSDSELARQDPDREA